MQSVPFPIRRVNRLRRAAEQARLVPAKPFDGWSACACEADKLMHVFDTLWVKAGFALHAYPTFVRPRAISTEFRLFGHLNR